MIRFECDYAEGAHPEIIRRLAETNMEQTPGYGEDAHCERAAALIRQACGAPEAQVHFLTGGTQANFTVIASILRPHQGVVCARSGHINVHESGAVEATGHKVIALPEHNGKLSAADLSGAVAEHWADPTHEHMVQPGMVYISHPTETGTLYSKAELEELSAVCREHGLPLFMDGARLGYGLMAEGTDITLRDIARLCDVFYIGGTKVGALFGEAVVVTDPALGRDFRYMIKQRGGMLAKGRLLGIQFETLFENGLYFDIAAHADRLAMRIRRAFEAKGVRMLCDSRTNQQFPILPDGILPMLSGKYSFAPWGVSSSGETPVRFCTSWATPELAVDELLKDISALL